MKFWLIALLLWIPVGGGCGDDDQGTPDNNTNNTNNVNNVDDCDPGMFRDTSGCVAWTTCQPGTYVSAPGTAETDRSCSPCGDRTYSDGENAAVCEEWTACVPGEFVESAGSATEDRMCAPCAADTLTTGENQSACVDADACLPGMEETTPATSTANVVCQACEAGTYCAGGSAPAIVCGDDGMWDDDADPSTECVLRTICVAGEFSSNEGDGTTDRVCDPCGAQMFSDQENAMSCSAWTACPSGEVVLAEPTAQSDRVCVLAPWTVQFGTINTEIVLGLAIASNGDIIASGYSLGAFPNQTNEGREDVFLARYDAAGTLQWRKQFGTSGNDRGTRVALDSAGNIVVAGYVLGELPGQTATGGHDAFIRKYDSAGNMLWTRQFGAASTDLANGLVVDGDEIIVTGETAGVLAGQTNEGEADVFVRKYDKDGTELWTQQFGSSARDVGMGVAVDGNGDIVCVGLTMGAFAGQTLTGTENAFIRKFDKDGVELWNKQFGTSDKANAQSVSVDSSNNIFVSGWATGALSGQTALGATDVYVQKLDPSGAIMWTRQFGTASAEVLFDSVVDADDRVLLTGRAMSGFPNQPSTRGGGDIFVVRFTGLGVEDAVWQLGSDGQDTARSVRVDQDGVVIVGGRTTGAFPGATNQGAMDGVIARLAP